MAERRFYWLKLPEGFFRQKEIKKLRQIAGGDTYTIIYLKMLLCSLKNGGKLFFEGVEDDFPAELALDIDESVENVTVTVNFLTSYGILVNCSSEEYELLTAADMTGSETAGARRVREHRERKALLCNGQALHSNTSVTGCNTDIDVETREKSIEKSSDGAASGEATCRTSDVRRVIEAWNALGLQTIKKIAPGTDRDQWLRKRIRDYGIDAVLEAIGNVRSSSFLMGDNRSGWQITFDWFIRPNNFPKVLDGNYADRAEPAGSNGNFDYSAPGFDFLEG